MIREITIINGDWKVSVHVNKDLAEELTGGYHFGSITHLNDNGIWWDNMDAFKDFDSIKEECIEDMKRSNLWKDEVDTFADLLEALKELERLKVL